LEIHERPRLAKSETMRLRAGSVVTVEPGVYLEGVGGVRIEDTILVETGGSETLTPADTEGWIVS
jgi:Xaa-Pro aminopeptidase